MGQATVREREGVKEEGEEEVVVVVVVGWVEYIYCISVSLF